MEIVMDYVLTWMSVITIILLISLFRKLSRNKDVEISGCQDEAKQYIRTLEVVLYYYRYVISETDRKTVLRLVKENHISKAYSDKGNEDKIVEGLLL